MQGPAGAENGEGGALGAGFLLLPEEGIAGLAAGVPEPLPKLPVGKTQGMVGGLQIDVSGQVFQQVQEAPALCGQGLFRLPALGDVEHGGPGHEKIAGRVGDGGGVQEHGEDAAVLAHQVVFHVFDPASLPGQRVSFPKKLFTVGGEDIRKLQPPHHLLPGVAQPGEFGVVDLDVGAVPVKGVVGARGPVVQVVHQLGVVRQGCFGLAALGLQVQGGEGEGEVIRQRGHEGDFLLGEKLGRGAYRVMAPTTRSPMRRGKAPEERKPRLRAFLRQGAMRGSVVKSLQMS